MPKARTKTSHGRTRRTASRTAKRTAPKKAAKRSPRSAPRTVRQPAWRARPARPVARPIDLYFWPTSNGIKISIMLEECRLPYTLHPINIGKGDQFKPEFLVISPNNRIPAIVDPDGPGAKLGDRRPISIFESGAILQYLGRKTGKFYPANERSRIEVDQWLFWQVGGLGPMAGQVHHFRNYTKEGGAYATERYVNEVNRLFGIMDKRLADRDFLAGRYSIADMACWRWAWGWERLGQDIEEFPNLKAWLERVSDRPGVRRGNAVGADLRSANYNLGDDPEAKRILFGQRAQR